MKPILFPSNATSFITNGLGRLDCTECIVTEERNGMYELELTIAESADHASDISMSSIIVAIPSVGASPQPFRVYKIEKPIKGIYKVYAQHISYQLSYIPVMPFNVPASASACNSALQGLKTNSAETNPYTFSTDVTTVAGFALTEPISLRSALGGVQGSILDKFGGEYEWDGYTVKLWSHRGVTTPTVTLRYGKNITDLEQEEYISNTITGICPFWSDSEGGNLVTLPEKVIESAYADNYPFKRTVTLDMSQDFKEKPEVEQLRTAANVYLGRSGIGIPTVSIKVSFINLADTDEYTDIAPLQTVKLCDMINVQFEKLGISSTAKIVKTTYDVLKERYVSVEVGSLRSSLASTIQNTNDAISTMAQSLSQRFAQFGEGIDDEIQNATAWLTSADGVIQALKNSDNEWTDLLCCDANATATTGNVLRINVNGIGFSSTGWNGPFKQAWTLDGRLVIGGTNVPSLTVYKTDAQTQKLFQVSQNGIEWNVPNSSMTADGTLTARNCTMNGQLISAVDEGGVEVKMVVDAARITGYRNDVEKGHIETGVRFWDGGIEYGASIVSSDYVCLDGLVATRQNHTGTYSKSYTGQLNRMSLSEEGVVLSSNITSKQVVTGIDGQGQPTIETIYVIDPDSQTTNRFMCNNYDTHDVINGIICQ